MKISFSPPDITELEIQYVNEVLESGWITTGPKTKEFEKRITEYCNADGCVATNSATAAMEMVLRLMDIGPGDEVITSSYTYTASASVIDHVGAKVILVDTAPDSYEMDYEKVASVITENTKVIIPVDIGGVMCDYERLQSILDTKKSMFKPKAGTLQELFDRAIILADAAHSFGATYRGSPSGSVADFTCFSFHAVKNLTTAEGGAIVWKNQLDSEKIYQQLMLLILHGQNKDALAKTKLGSWEYDIIGPYYKCNMTDINAAIGLAQLERYDEIIAKRHYLLKCYEDNIQHDSVEFLCHNNSFQKSSGHLCMMRIKSADEKYRNYVIEQLAINGIASNVHFKPLPMMTAYRNMGFDISNYPNAYNQYRNEITLPSHNKMSDKDMDYVLRHLTRILGG